jgi:hypothetical protein
MGSVYKPEDLKGSLFNYQDDELYLRFLLHNFRVTTSKSVLRNLLLETVANLGKERQGKI